MDAIGERWREKYYDKCAELNASETARMELQNKLALAECEIDFLRGHAEGAIKTNYFIMNKEYLAKDVIERFRADCEKRYPRNLQG
jgi:hypothetical protein